MQRSLTRTWASLARWLLQRIVLVLTILFCAGVGLALANMFHLSKSLIQSQAVQDLTLHAQVLNQAINLYSESAVNRAKVVPGITVTHDYLTHTGGIPLPSTFAIELGDRISEQETEMSARLYSDYPFPWRRAKGGPRDDFEREALQQLRQNPKQPFSRFENQNGHAMVRYGEASIMQATCVACHNSHPDSPKKDWEVGDVAGVWEINESLDDFVAKVNSNLRGTLLMFGGISVLGLSGLTLVIGKLRQTNRELEGRVKERTTDLVHANTDLEKRNQLIRQVFGRYLSDNVVATLLDEPEGLKLGGERRTLTILTSDLRGFSALSEQIQPEQVIDILNLYLERMADVINHYQGTIDEFMGDGILVLFGAPIVRENDAERAIACACAMQLEMGAVNERLRSLNLPLLEMGIGINTGEVVVGNIGSEKRTKYGIVGSQVNLTYRIESYTKGGQILISEKTLSAAGKTVKIIGKQQVQPKGFQKPFTVYEVYGIGGFFNLYLPREEQTFVTLSRPILLQYAVLDEKHINSKLFTGCLTRLSKKAAEIWVEDVEQQGLPPKLANLKLNLILPESSTSTHEDVYAKVLERSADDCFLIHFTSIPLALKAELDALYASHQL